MDNILSEIMYIICDFICSFTGFKAIKNIPTFIFWNLLAITFIFGKYIPYEITGLILIILGLITLTKQLKMSKFKEISDKLKLENSEKFKNLLFIPALAIGIAAFILMQLGFPTAASIGLGSLIALFLAMIIIKPKIYETIDDNSKLVMQVGHAALLPQLLAALSSVFTKSGVGEVISSFISNIIPNDNIYIAIIVYVLAMALFTMIMGNGFAAFSVITVGIAIPFIISKGLDPEVIGALGMTAGFCGTLMTPMAANFNIVPVSILEIKDKYGIIKTQIPVALALLISHILLMILLA